MGMPQLAHSWSRDEVLALPDDGKRYELVDGELLVSPSPRGLHQRAVLELVLRVQPYVRTHRLGGLLIAPADLDLRSGQLVQPDVFVGRMVGGREPVEWSEFGIPILVAEVLSPSTARYDRVTKRRLYQRSGVETYWVVDVDARVVEAWTPGAERPELVDRTLGWRPDPSVEPIEIDLTEYFGAVRSEELRSWIRRRALASVRVPVGPSLRRTRSPPRSRGPVATHTPTPAPPASSPGRPRRMPPV